MSDGRGLMNIEICGICKWCNESGQTCFGYCGNCLKEAYLLVCARDIDELEMELQYEINRLNWEVQALEQENYKLIQDFKNEI